MASRNRKELSRRLFQNLVAYAASKDVAIANAAAPRWIAKKDDDDIELMTRAECSTVLISRQIKFVQISHNEKSYLAFVGIEWDNKEVSGARQIEVSPAILVLSVLEMDLLPVCTGSEIKEQLESLYEGVVDYGGHEISSLMPLFQSLHVFELTGDFISSSDKFRMAGIFLSRAYTNGPLMLSGETLNCLAYIFEVGNEYIPYELVVQGMMSFSWSGLFLELYRCIEQLYPIPRIEALVSRWSPNMSFRSVAEIFEETLSWRPKEEEALYGLLSQCSIVEVRRLIQAFGADPPTERDRCCQAAARLVYKRRNHIVHFRPLREDVDISEDVWNTVVQILSRVIIELYEVYGEKFHEAPV